MWDVVQTEWRWGRFFSEYLGFTVSYHTNVPCVSMAEMFPACFNTTVCPFEFLDSYDLLFFFACVRHPILECTTCSSLTPFLS
jgi:hypothetical protein